jgi:hypothetical protein
MINWYNILVDAQLTDFAEAEEKAEITSEKTEENSSDK